MKSFLLLTGAPVPVILLVRTPVESASDNVIPAGRIGVVVASGLSDIDFARFGPWSESIVDWQQPDGGPEPVALWHLGYNFDTTVLDCRTFESVDTA